MLRESINSYAGCQQILQSLCTNIQLCIVACTAHTGLKLGIVAACCFQTLRSLTQLSETQCREASHGRLLKSSQGRSLCYCPPCPFCLLSSPCSLSSLPCCLSLAACACLAYSFEHVFTACITCCWLPCSPSCCTCPFPFVTIASFHICLLPPSYFLFFWPFPSAVAILIMMLLPIPYG